MSSAYFPKRLDRHPAHSGFKVHAAVYQDVCGIVPISNGDYSNRQDQMVFTCDMKDPTSSWEKEQCMLRQLVVEHDNVDWQVPGINGSTGDLDVKVKDTCTGQCTNQSLPLRLIGGVDISFMPEMHVPASQESTSGQWGTETGNNTSQEHGIASLVVMTIPELEVVYEDYQQLPLDVPYMPGFLAFREVPAYQQLLARVRCKDNGKYVPQVLLVDGCGVLHPHGCGSACHLGVVENIPTIGVAKNLLAVDGLERIPIEAQLQQMHEKTKVKNVVSPNNGQTEQPTLEQHNGTITQVSTQEGTSMVQREGHEGQSMVAAELQCYRAGLLGGFVLPLIGKSGKLWGAALTSRGSKKPLYVSIGHRVGLRTALQVVARCCKHRIPEPIRQADLRSREAARQLSKTMNETQVVGNA